MNFHPFVFLWQHCLSDKAYMNFQLSGTYIRLRGFKYQKKKLRDYSEKKRANHIFIVYLLWKKNEKKGRSGWNRRVRGT